MVSSVVSLPSLAAKETVQEIRYTGERYRDPTVSPLAVAVQPAQEEGPVRLPPLEVQGIILGKQEPRAIVNQRIVKKGDLVEGAEILAITQKGIRIFFKGKSGFLKPGGAVEESP